jgi:hypothetical protein
LCEGRGKASLCLLVAVLVSVGASCGSKGSVALTAAVENPSLAFTQTSPLGGSLTGNFSLHLELGPAAPTSTDVHLSGFQLVRPADQSALSPIKATASPAEPYHLEPGAKVDVQFTIADQPGTPTQFVAASNVTAICQARTVQIAASVTDSASGGSTPVTSPKFDVTGCP